MLRYFLSVGWAVLAFFSHFQSLQCAQPPSAAALAELAQDSAFAASASSPYLAVRTFLDAMASGEASELQKAGALFRHSAQNSSTGIEIAWKLRQVLDGTGQIIYVEDISPLPRHLDSATGKHRYVLFEDRPNIYLEYGDRAWYFPSRSTDAIEMWHKEIFPFGMDKILQVLPRLGGWKFLSLYLWQWVILIVLLFVTWVFQKGFKRFIEHRIRNFLLKKGYTQGANAYFLPALRALSWLITFSVLGLFVPVLQLPAQLTQYLTICASVLKSVFLTILLYQLVNILHVYLMSWAESTESTLDDHLVKLLRKVLKIFVTAFGGLLILNSLSIPILPLLTGLSLGGLAFALAAQDTIKNFFGSLMIFVDKPFQIGDWITSGDIDGTIEEVGFRSTRVRTFRDSVIYVPNAVLADGRIDNHGLRHFRRYYAKLCIPYETPPARIEQFVTGLHTLLQSHPKTHKKRHEIHLNEFAKEGLVIMFYIFIKSANWSGELKVRHELNIGILRLASDLDISFAYGLDIALSSRSLQTSEELRKKYQSSTQDPHGETSLAKPL